MKKWIAVFCILLLLLPLTAAAAPSEWAAEDVNRAWEYGLLGDWATAYQTPITREDFATLIVTCVIKKGGVTVEEYLQAFPAEKRVSPFSDVDNAYVTSAYIMGVTKGVGDGGFAPAENISRQEIATMMHRAVLYAQRMFGSKYLTEEGAELSGFSDGDQVEEWAKESVAALAGNGIMRGTDEAALLPREWTTTEQAILLAVRIYERML